MYEEQITDGQICYRTDPDADWIPYPVLDLWNRYQQGQTASAALHELTIKVREMHSMSGGFLNLIEVIDFSGGKPFPS